MNPKFEKLNIDPINVEKFRLAIIHAGRTLLLSNNSVHVTDTGEIFIYETRAIFLINLGMEYQKLLSNSKLQ